MPLRSRLLLCLTLGASLLRAAVPDPRHLSNGHLIPSEGYADQPYIVRTDDGAWLCVMTTGSGAEGAKGQHVVSRRSLDRGKTWENAVDLEPADGPEASYAVLLKVPGGRIYAFYNHNTDRVPEVKREDGGVYKRVDSLGHYVFKYSDDHGRSWSAQRHEIPVREFDIDRANLYGGKLRFFWNVGRPLVLGDAVLCVLHKVGAMGPGFFAQSEGAFLRSSNILTERDPTRLVWETLPAGTVGLRTPAGGGRVAEEQSIVALSDGSLFCIYRTVDGWPAQAYSRDGGRTWSAPAWATYAPGGPRIKHPRAANFVWRCANGRYLYWFHNHGGPAIARKAADLTGRSGSPYDDRNPAWLAAGVERDGPDGKVIHWSQPEIVLYEDDRFVRLSYPDLIEEDGKFYLTETQKNLGRVHEVPADLVAGLFAQFENRRVAAANLALDLRAPALPPEAKLPRLPAFLARDPARPDHGTKDLRTGFSLDFWLSADAVPAGTVLLDNRNAAGEGFAVVATAAGTLRLTLHDGREESAWECDRGLLPAGRPHHVVVTVDGGPKIITFVIDGVLADGGDERQFGWGRFSPALRSVQGADTLKIAPAVRRLRVYTRALRTSEAVGNHRADAENPPR
ncbi:MAG: hypothetical protein B9S34_14975 [Opitutia bacterium Tous-C1TDCM]|nr:MAG: hypothetical protein B9S34_14975 [Opitutae bacterium Tous-C1TDCM]